MPEICWEAVPRMRAFICKGNSQSLAASICTPSLAWFFRVNRRSSMMLAPGFIKKDFLWYGNETLATLGLLNGKGSHRRFDLAFPAPTQPTAC